MTPSSVIDAVVIPVIRMAAQARAVTAVSLLMEEGINTFEITLTTPGALAVITDLRRNSDLTVGAGTVLSRQEARACIDAGAQFIVSPVVRPDIAEFCVKRNIPCFLGAATPTEILAAHEAGASAVKVFPAVQLGGPGFIKAVKSVFPHIAIMPTGGITIAEIPTYLAAGAAAVGMGGKLVDEQAIIDGRADDIRSAARQVREQIMQIKDKTPR